MNHSNLNTFRLSNEQLLLVNILNSMYNDNVRHITMLSETLNSMTEHNNQIRSLLVQLLNTNQNSVQNNSRRNNQRRWNNSSSVNNSDRIMLNNQPYIIDSISEYTLPRSRQNRGTVDDFFTQILNNFLQPIEIYPTQLQIESATRRVRYCDIARPINTSCPISMEDFNDNDMVIVIRHCGHTFHNEHLINWFRSNCRCPVCRYDIREYNSNTSSQYFNTNNETVSDSSTNNLTIDSSNNIPERNNNSNQNSLFNEDFLNHSLENIYGITGFDSSNNFMNTSADTLTMFLINALNRSRNTR